MTNTKLYTAIGKFKLNHCADGIRCPLVTVGKREYILDMQEMMLWTILNWRILSDEEIGILYERKVDETGFMDHRNYVECLKRLVQRGLVAQGQGYNSIDALYDLLSELYIIPISENIFLRIISFIKFTLFSKIPFSSAKKLFSKDKRDAGEKKIMKLANQSILSTAEMIKCINNNDLKFSTNEELMDALYYDEYTTSDNIAYCVHSLPECCNVLKSVANLYLRKQIIFERNL